MAKQLELELQDIERAISSQAQLVEEMVSLAYRGLQERCLGTAADVLSLEKQLNQMEINIEEQCLVVLAVQQPVAKDLRRVAAAIKVNSDLERIGDLALNLAERTESLMEFPDIEIPTKLTRMVKKALAMLRDANHALATGDNELAESVVQRDDEIDELNSELIAEVSELMEQSPTKVKGYLHVFSATRIVERMGDYATNIAEDVVYLVNGEIKRHSPVW